MPRSNQTKHLLAQSMQELMASAPLEKISVNDIVEHAGVGRNTFYYHFEDKYDLVNWIFQSGFTRFLVAHSGSSDWGNLLDDMQEFFRQNKTFYMNALSYIGQNCLTEYIFNFASNLFAQRLLNVRPDATPTQQQFVGDFFAGALMGIFLPWVRAGMRAPNGNRREDQLRILLSCDLSEFLSPPSTAFMKDGE